MLPCCTAMTERPQCSSWQMKGKCELPMSKLANGSVLSHKDVCPLSCKTCRQCAFRHNSTSALLGVPAKQTPRAAPQASDDAVCVWDGAIWSRSGRDFRMFDFAGKHYFRFESDASIFSSPLVVWHESAVISWLSCEQNLNHFIGETLGPAHASASALASSAGGAQPRPHLVVASPAMWPNPQPDGCVGNRFLELLTMMPTRPQVFVARAHAGGEGESRHSASYYSRLPPSRIYDASRHASKDLRVPHCFRRFTMAQVMRAVIGPSAIPQDFYRDVAARAPPGTCERGRGYTLLMQRRGHRCIENEAEVVRALERRFGLPVRTAAFEDHPTVQAQMALACGAQIFVGVHGMGMEWGHFINGGTGVGLIVEIAWNRWPCHYTRRMHYTGKWAICLPGSPTPPPEWVVRAQAARGSSNSRHARVNPSKYVNVTLNVSMIDAIDPATTKVGIIELRRNLSSIQAASAAIRAAGGRA